MKNPFAVSAETLVALSDERAERLAGMMIAAEADSAGVRPGGMRGGGAGFEVIDAPRESAGGLVGRGRTLFRIEPGGPSPARNVRSMLLQKGGALGNAMRDCLEGGGALAVILANWGGPGAAEPGLEGMLAEALRGRLPRGGRPVRVWAPARIASLLGRYPHLALFANSSYPEGLRAHDAWSRLGGMQHAFRPGRGEDEFVRRLRGILLGDRIVHVQVTGEPGSGRTRLALEATRDERLRGRVLYADGPGPARRLVDHVNMGGTGGSENSIVVVDECSGLEHACIQEEIANSSRIRLVTVHGEAGEGAPGAVHMPVPPLADEQVREIISEYTGAGGGTGGWAEYCRASPRAAHIVGACLRGGPGGAPPEPGDAAVWDRCIAGRDGPNGPEFRARKAALVWLGLFREIGCGGARARELDAVAGLAERDAGVTRREFMGAVSDLRGMDLLRGASALHITPKLLHVRMWAEWWENHEPGAAPWAGRLAGGGGDEGGVLESLLQRHFDMYSYARGSAGASMAAKKMLQPGGPLDSDGALRSRLGAAFLSALAPVDPASTLACIERIAGRAGAGPGGALGGAHQGVAHALAQTLSDAGSFRGAMRLLLGLAVAGGGVDAARAHDLIPPLEAYCRALDPSNEAVSAPLSARLAVLSEAAQSASAGERRVAVLACASVLSMRRRSIAVPRCRGFERVPDPWTPRDRGEAAGYCLGVFKLLRAAALDAKDARIREEAAAAAVETAHQAALVPGLSLPVADLLGGLAASGAADRALILDKVALLLDAEADRIGPRAAEALSSLRGSMEGTGLSAELRRRVGRHARGGWGAEEEEENDREAAALGDLADRAVRGGAVLAELDWLVSDGAVDGLAFGREVAVRDPDLQLLDPILEAMRGAGPSAAALFLSGYLLPLAEGRRGGLELLLDRMLADAALRAHVPEVTWRTGATERAVERLTAGVLDRTLGLGPMQVLRYGHRLQGAGAGAVAGLAGAVLERCGSEDGAGATALDMLHSYFVAGPKRGAVAASAAPLPEGLALEALLHRDFDGAADGAPPDHVACAAWRDLAAALARRGGVAASLALAEAMIDRFGDSALLHAPGPEPPSAALAEIAACRPREVWGMIAARLDPPLDRRARRLLAWIEEGGGSKTVGAGRLAAALMPWIVAWVGEDPDERAGLVSGHLPPIFSAVRGFAARFGDREDVRDGLAGRFAAGAYRGSLVSHCADKRRWALDASKAEVDPNVLSFLGRYVGLLEAQMGLEAPAEGGGIAAA